MMELLKKQALKIVLIGFLVFALVFAYWIWNYQKSVTVGEHNHGPNNTHVAPYDENGVPLVKTREAIDDWHPVRAKFIKGLISHEGDIWEQVEGTVSEDLETGLQELEEGEYADSVPDELPSNEPEQVYLSAYELTERFTLTSGKPLEVTISYYQVSPIETKWLVTSYKIG